MVPTSNPLEASVLILNKFFYALHVIPARRAFILLTKGIAEIIDEEAGQFVSYDLGRWVESADGNGNGNGNDDWVRTISRRIRVPRILRLLGYGDMPRRDVQFSRRNLYTRDGYRCQYCNRRLPPAELSLDHVVPRAYGGRSTWENMVAACGPCQRKKGGRTPSEVGMRLLAKPVRPKTNPTIVVKMRTPKYAIWRTFMKDVDLSADGDGGEG
ncbi:MAG: HNH endonuclease [Planctomycetota bacterium]